MVRAPFYDKNGLKKGAWSVEEDNKLRSYIQRFGHWNWRELPKLAGLSRCGKSCRLRWVNYLQPDVKRGNYTEEEELMIIKLHEELGNKRLATLETLEQSFSDFWTEPFVLDNTYIQNNYPESLANGGFSASQSCYNEGVDSIYEAMQEIENYQRISEDPYLVK
uniref:Uncharacterized protein n=1 Tax=Quercus lobata TaxID=97700 RepID=A0A7N2M861_QUELO